MSTTENKKPRGGYIPAALAQHELNGDAYVMIEDAYQLCTDRRCSYAVFVEDLREQLKVGRVCREGRRLYRSATLRHENVAAGFLAATLKNPVMKPHNLTKDLGMLEQFLNEQQCEAVRMALACRLSIVLGGAGTGKTTLIQGIVEAYDGGGTVLLTAPTGKAARNLTERTFCEARTVHSALGLTPEDDGALTPVVWTHVGLVIVDEASMLTLQLLAGIFHKMHARCQVVLVGDPNQLLSVGAGNVLPDLVNLGVPCVRLLKNYRQEEQETALYHNVTDFVNICSGSELRFDDSFHLEHMNELDAEKALVEEAARRYQAGESVQVLSPYNSKTNLSVHGLNCSLQAKLNPPQTGKPELPVGKGIFRDGDRVIITKNNYEANCVNGDVGILHIEDGDKECPKYWVELPDGRKPNFIGWGGLSEMSLAYALTVHKSQGSQYDTILFPVIERFSGMLYRNLFYTASSRAQKRVILYGCMHSLDVAVQTEAKPRNSMLVEKTNMLRLREIA